MKRTLLIALVAIVLPLTSQAQLGNLLEKAAKKAVKKTTEKLVDKAADKASDAATKAIDKEIDKRLPSDKSTPLAEPTEQATYKSLMQQLPELPSVDQLTKYQEAKLNDKTLALVTSRVTAFSTKVLDLSAQCATLNYRDLDSAQAMRLTEAYTGLSQSELQQLSAMSEEEQQAWLQNHYSQERAEANLAKQAVDASKWIEPLQPQIDRWSQVGDKISGVYKEMDTKLQPLYSKYAPKLEQASGKERTSLLIAYYAEAAPHIRTAVQQALTIRLQEQLPIAEQIEGEMVKIRTSNPDAINQLISYPQLTATQYFSEVMRLLEIPEYRE